MSGATETGDEVMDLKIIIIIAVSYLYGLFEVLMNLRQRGRGKVTSSDDKGSLWLLYGLITLGYALSFSIGQQKRAGFIHGTLFLRLAWC